MEELWRKVSELMWKQPLLWVPVLVADLLGFFINVGREALLRSIVLSHTQYHSVLGGNAVPAHMSPAAAQSTTVLVLVITWTLYFVRLLLYTSALVVTATLVRGVVERNREAVAGLGKALRSHFGSIVSLSLRALAVYGVIALAFSWLSLLLIRHGHKTALASPWLQIGASVLGLALLAFLLPPLAVQALSGHLPARPLARRAQWIALLLGMASVLLSQFVTTNLHAVHIASAGARYPLEATGSWITALPYALMFVALSLIAIENRRAAQITETAA